MCSNAAKTCPGATAKRSGWSRSSAYSARVSSISSVQCTSPHSQRNEPIGSSRSNRLFRTVRRSLTSRNSVWFRPTRSALASDWLKSVEITHRLQRTGELRMDVENAIRSREGERAQDSRVGGDDEQRAVVPGEPLRLAQQQAERRRVEERDAAQVDDEVAGAELLQAPQASLELRRAREIELALDGEDVGAATERRRPNRCADEGELHASTLRRGRRVPRGGCVRNRRQAD